MESKIIHGDCLDVLRKGSSDAVDLIVSDDALNDGKVSGGGTARKGFPGGKTFGGSEMKAQVGQWFGDSGSYSRFFSLDAWASKLPESVQKTFPFLIVPKASKREKNEGCENLPDMLGGSLEGGNDTRDGKDKPQLRPTKNGHPTTKPLTLMSYLITLGSRPGDTVLDPFVGSGTTVCAAKMLGRKGVGIEREEEYVKIAQARLDAVKIT